MNDIEAVIERLQDTGLKVNPQRLEILEILRGNKTHPSADEILHQVRKKFPSTSYSTVNSTLDALCRKHRIPDAVKASNMIVTVKRRFQAILRRHVRQLVDSDSEVYEEIRHFMGIFALGRAG